MTDSKDEKKSSTQSLLNDKVNSNSTGAYKSRDSIKEKIEENYDEEYMQNILLAQNKVLKITSDKLEERAKRNITQGVITKKKLEENNAMLDEQNTDYDEEIKLVTFIENELDLIKNKIIKAYKNIPPKGKRIIRYLLGVVGCLLLLLLYRYEVETHTYDIQIKGDEVISIYEGGKYKEAGYVAYNSEKENTTNKVKVVGKVDTETVGEYKLEYVIHTFWKDNRVSRTVKVLKNPLDGIYFTLNGDDEVTIKLREKYVDPGYNIRSKDNLSYDKYVTVSNFVDTTKIGDYEVKYLIKINKKEQELVRKVKVVGEPYTVKIVNPAPTRSNVSVELTSNIQNFSHFIVNGNKVLKESIEFSAPENGTYEFKMYDTKGKATEIKVDINNIDRVPPTGTCQAYMSSGANNTTFNMSINDQSRITKYIHTKQKNNAYQNNGFTIPSIVNDGNVIVYDEAGNFSEIGCTYDYAPIYPNGQNVIHSFDGETMKYWVEAATPTYDVTHIWVKDSYGQFKVAISDPFPVLERPGIIMNRASQKYGYYGKAMIGANGSGFVTNDFYREVARWYPQWKWSSVSPIVIVDGVVLRNYTNLPLPGVGANTYGMKRDGYFEAYYVNSATDMQANIAGVQRMIDEGVLYTFAFNPVLVYKGVKATGLETVPNIRQGVGQIDKNNFVIVTNTTVNRNWGLTTQQLADIMFSLGCYTAFNTDGGGSTNLIYKNRNTDAFSGIVVSQRDVADIFYFVEK